MIISLGNYFGMYLRLMSSALCLVFSWRVTYEYDKQLTLTNFDLRYYKRALRHTRAWTIYWVFSHSGTNGLEPFETNAKVELGSNFFVYNESHFLDV